MKIEISDNKAYAIIALLLAIFVQLTVNPHLEEVTVTQTDTVHVYDFNSGLFWSANIIEQEDSEILSHYCKGPIDYNIGGFDGEGKGAVFSLPRGVSDGGRCWYIEKVDKTGLKINLIGTKHTLIAWE